MNAYTPLPPYLQSGDVVAVVAASGFISSQEVVAGTRVIEGAGFRVILADNLTTQYGRFAGTGQQRLDNLQAFINNPDVKAIVMARGGYGLTQIIDQLDLTPLQNHPKWLVGFSDVTPLLHKWANSGLAAIHGPCCGT